MKKRKIGAKEDQQNIFDYILPEDFIPNDPKAKPTNRKNKSEK